MDTFIVIPTFYKFKYNQKLSIGGTISKVEELANTLRDCFDSGAKKILLPMSSDTVYQSLGIE